MYAFQQLVRTREHLGLRSLALQAAASQASSAKPQADRYSPLLVRRVLGVCTVRKWGEGALVLVMILQVVRFRQLGSWQRPRISEHLRVRVHFQKKLKPGFCVAKI